MFKLLLKKSILIPLILVIIIVSVVMFFRSRNGAIEVKTVTPSSTKVVKSVSASGAVKSEVKSEMSFAITGTVAEVAVSEGDFVKKGELLIRLESFDLFQSAQSKKDSRDITMRDRDLFIENYATNLSGFGGRDEYEIELRRQNELVSKAEADYQVSLSSLGKSHMYASSDGTVIEINVEVGESIAFSEAVVTIANLEKLIFEIEVDQEDFGFVKIGQKVEVILDSYEDEIFEGKVTKLPLFASGEGDDFVIEIELNAKMNTNNPVLLGMTGDADIIIEETGSEIPSLMFDSLFTDDEGTFVWAAENGTAKKIRVSTGLEGDIYTEVTSDLSQYTVIVPSGDDELEEGSKIKISK